MGVLRVGEVSSVSAGLENGKGGTVDGDRVAV